MSVLGRLVKGDVGKDGGSCDGGRVGIVHWWKKPKKLEDALNACLIS